MNYRNLILLLAILATGCGHKINEKLKYLEQKRPTSLPEIFAPNIISNENYYEFGSVFNAAATEFFYGVNVNGKSQIRYSGLEGDRWSKPITILADERYGYNDPFLSPDEKKLYFISKRSLDGRSAKQDHDIWYVEKEGNGWSDPINAGPNINTEGNEYYISFTKNGRMYFSSNINAPENRKRSDFDIYYSTLHDGKFQKPVRLSDAINTQDYEADVFIDLDESYMIFCANRSEGFGEGDLYISFKNADGTWTKSKNMGSSINSENHELCPFVSNDGKYFFYTSNKDIYWVNAQIIEGLRE